MNPYAIDRTTPVFQLPDTVPGATQANDMLRLQQGEYSTESPADQAGRAIQNARSGYDSDAPSSIAGKINAPSGLAGDELTQCQEYILTFSGPMGDFSTVTIPDATLAAMKDPGNAGPDTYWNASNARLGIGSVPGVASIVPIGSAINPADGTRVDNWLILPADQ